MTVIGYARVSTTDQDLSIQKATLKATRQPIDTSTVAGKCFVDMLGVFAEFETSLRREQQLEGIAKAKAAGVNKGRPASLDAERVRKLKVEGMEPTEIAKTLGVGLSHIVVDSIAATGAPLFPARVREGMSDT